MKICGAYHLHSLYSKDGTFSLFELKKRLIERGMSFAIVTEHADHLSTQSFAKYVKECDDLSDSTFVFIAGLEVPYVGDVHIGCFPVSALKEVPLYLDGIKELKRLGATTVYHHPSKEKYYFDETLESFSDGIEIWNSRYEGRVAPSNPTMAFAKEKFSKKIFFGGLDLHTHHQFGGPCIVVDIESLSKENILRSLSGGLFSISGKYYSINKNSAKLLSLDLYRRILRIAYVILKSIR